MVRSLPRHRRSTAGRRGLTKTRTGVIAACLRLASPHLELDAHWQVGLRQQAIFGGSRPLRGKLRRYHQGGARAGSSRRCSRGAAHVSQMPQNWRHLQDAVSPALERRQLSLDREIGSASCRERVGKYVEISVVAVSLKKTQYHSKMIKE